MNEAVKSHTSTSALLGALLFLAAKDQGVVFDGVDTGQLSAADAGIVAAVAETLGNQIDDELIVHSTLAEVTRSIVALRRLPSPVTLTGTKYDACRTEVLAGLGVESAQGASVWPPTSQTMVMRFGSWNEALKAAGLAVSKIGRAKGQLRFDAADYDRAISEFIADCEEQGRSTVYLHYTEYAAARKGEVPSAAAVRKFYGSWSKALTAATGQP